MLALRSDEVLHIERISWTTDPELHLELHWSVLVEVSVVPALQLQQVQVGSGLEVSSSLPSSCQGMP